MDHGDIFISSGVGDQFCGNFVISPHEEALLWQAEPHLIVSGTLSIYYDDGDCDLLEVRAGKLNQPALHFTVPKKNTRSYTIKDLNNVRVRCLHAGARPLRGKYCLSIHYMLQEELEPCEEE